jgi:hypothetical protein
MDEQFAAVLGAAQALLDVGVVGRTAFRVQLGDRGASVFAAELDRGLSASASTRASELLDHLAPGCA